MVTNKEQISRRVVCGGLAVPVISGTGSAAMDQPRGSSEWNVLEFGAVGDGVTDNTGSFQRALDAAGQALGGAVVVPGGRYSFSGSLRVPKDVTLRGIFRAPSSHSFSQTKQKPEYGTVFWPRGGAGSEEGPAFIDLDSNAVLEGVSVFYPGQKLDPPPKPYPYAVYMHGNNPTVQNVELLNPYNGIKIEKGGRQSVRDVCGQPLHIGLFVDQAGDCCRLENVHWNPYWTYESPLSRWQLDNGVGFIFVMHWPVDIRNEMKQLALIHDNLGLARARERAK